MIQPAFNFGNPEQALASAGSQLIIEVSTQSLNYILFKKYPTELLLLRQYRLYTTGDRTVCDVIGEVAEGDELITQHAGDALIVYNFPEANLIPARYYHESTNQSADRIVHGEHNGEMIFGEEVKNLQMHNVYRVPRQIHSFLKNKFQGSRYWHIYTLLLLSEAASGNKNVIRAVFYHDNFIAAFYLDDKLQLIQTFSYQTPEDVAYYLLLLCRQFNMQQQNMDLVVSGLIDCQSALYSELLKYFSNVQEDSIPEGIAVDKLAEEFPAHYFSSLLKMSLCEL